MKMNNLQKTIFLLIFLIVIGYTNPAFSESDSSKSSMPKVLLQLQIRDSTGQLVSYVEGSKIVFLKPELLNEFLDKLGNKKIIEKDGKKYELFQWFGPDEKFNRFHSYAGYELKVLPVNGKYRTVLMILHNAYQTQPGDTAKVYWSALRPID